MICMAGDSSDLVLIAVRQQREETRALDGRGQLTLIERAGACQAGRRDLAVLADEIAQHVDVLVVDVIDLGDRETAEALAAEQQRLLVALRALVLGEPGFWRGHVMTSEMCSDDLERWG